MQRFVNDCNIVQKVQMGYSPVIPLEIQDVGGDTFALLMEMTDADYKQRQTQKQIKNDMNAPLGGIDLANYKKDIKIEAIFLLRQMPARKVFGLLWRKIFRCKTYRYIEGGLSD